MSILEWLQAEETVVVLRVIQSLFTILAIIVGGIWTYRLFVKRRQRYPRANITQQIKHFSLPDRKILLRIALRICNEGEILLSLVSGFVRVQQVIPCSIDLSGSTSDQEICAENREPEEPWPVLDEKKLEFQKGEREIEPGETDELHLDFVREIEPGETDELHFDFVIDSDVQVVIVYSYLKNVKKRRREIGWNVTSIYNLCSGS